MTTDLSHVDASESNAAVHARLGDSTGYVPRVKTAFGADTPPAWMIHAVGSEFRIVPRTRLSARHQMILRLITAALLGIVAWMAIAPPRMNPGGSGAVIAGILFALSVGWYSTLYPLAVHATTAPLAIVDLKRRAAAFSGWATELRADEIVRLELVRVSYTFRRPHWSGFQDGSTLDEYHLVACVRESPARVVWRVIDDLGSFGLKEVASEVASALQVPCERVRVTRYTNPE